jgi:GT2 family glycosyltransferase
MFQKRLKNNLSLAIVTYQHPSLLLSCLNSIYSQTHQFPSIIIVDNDPGQSAKIIVKQFSRYKNIHYYHNHKNNLSAARNFAIKICSTSHLAFIDDDCLLTPQWSKIALKAINSFKKDVVAFQGHSVLPSIQRYNHVSKAIFHLYQQWINQDLFAIDTKNVIFNIPLVKKLSLSFDTNLPIFEDVDFGLQIKKQKLKIIFIPNMSVFHPEVSNVMRAIKKFYYRGQIKYDLHQKWGDYDHYIPKNNFLETLRLFKNNYLNIVKSILQIAFNSGYLSQFNKNTIFLINTFDKAANQERLLAVSAFLSKHRYQVEIIDSQKLFDKHINNFWYFLVSPFSYFLYRFTRILVYKFKISKLSPWLFYRELIIRGKILNNFLNHFDAKLVISQNPLDLCVSTSNRKYKIILDQPTIFSKEIRLKKNYSKNIVNHISTLEKNAYRQADRICFHWYSFLKLAKNKYPKLINKYFVLNWGCSPTSKKSRFSLSPKIIYLGKLNTNWINPSLLTSLQKKSSIPINIFSYEKPSSKIYPKSLKYQGYLKQIKHISKYQFGLISLSNDSLRNNGFSAKHLLYLSYGIPVLCPDSRQDPLLAPATIYYNEKNFNQKIKKYSQQKFWLKKHSAAINLSQELNWDKTLKPLLKEITILKQST